MLEVGFEPTPPKREELKSPALDPSAIQAIFAAYGIRTHASEIETTT